MIPITFNKDDLQNEKKGTIRAQDLASLVALCYPKKVGILDIFNNPLTITNVDLGTTGYVKLTFNKGYVVCYGRLIYVEQSELVTLPLPASTEDGNLGIRINLAESGASEVSWFMKSGTLRTDNLLNNVADGVYEIAIYTYSANNLTFNLGTKIAQTIPSITDYLSGANFETLPRTDGSNKIATTKFVQNLVGGVVNVSLGGGDSPTGSTVWEFSNGTGSGFTYTIFVGEDHGHGDNNLVRTIRFPYSIFVDTEILTPYVYQGTNVEAKVQVQYRDWDSITYKVNDKRVGVNFLIMGSKV